MVERTDDPWAEFRGGGEQAAEPIPNLPSRENPWADFTTGPPPSTPPTARITVRPQGAMQTFEDVARSASNAVTFGQMDRIRAGIDVATGDQPNYDKALADAVRKSKEAETAAGPFLTSTGQAIGGLVGGGALPAAGVTLIRQTQPLALKAMAGLAEGGFYGAVQGAGNTYTGNLNDYASNALMGGVLGGGIGLGAPVVGRVGSAAYHKLANRGAFGGVPKPLADAARADAQGLAVAANTPGAMLPDAGPSMLGVTQGAYAGATGPGKTALEASLRARDRAVPTQVRGTVNQLFGGSPIPSHVEEGIRGRMQALGPHYDRALNAAGRVDTDPIALWIEGEIGGTKGPAQAALRQVRAMLDIPTNPGVLDPHPRALQATREAVRDMRDNPNAEPGVQRVMGRVYDQITREMQARIPGIRQLDSAYAELGAQERAIRAQSAGGRIFKTDQGTVIRPVEMAETMLEAAQPKGVNIGPSAEPLRLRQAARDELERVVGTTGNNLQKLKSILGDIDTWNADKLGVMFGPGRAVELLRVRDRLLDEREVYQKIVHGSKTAQTTASAASLDPAKGKIPVEATLFGAGTRLTQEALDAMRAGTSAVTRDRVAQMMAATSQREKQALVQQMLEAQPSRDRRADITRWLIEHGMIGAGTATTAPTTRPVGR
jgi:hypothetical protein